MEIREYKPYNEEEILSLYESVGWTAYTNQPEVLWWKKRGRSGRLRCNL